MTALAAGLAIAYLVGSIPTAWLVGRARGVDLGKVGSGNFGATNVYRSLGAGSAAVVLLVDVAKGFLPVVLLPRWLATAAVPSVAYGVLLAMAAVLGHVFSIFLGFRGGKGIGTAAGAYGALVPAALAAAAVVWLALVAWRRVVSLASLAAAVTLLAVVLAIGARDLQRAWPLVGMTVVLVGLVFWTHRENIGRLSRGEERPIARRGGGRR